MVSGAGEESDNCPANARRHAGRVPEPAASVGPPWVAQTEALGRLQHPLVNETGVRGK